MEGYPSGDPRRGGYQPADPICPGLESDWGDCLRTSVILEGEELARRCMGEHLCTDSPKPGDGGGIACMQIITSGPDTKEPHIRNNYLELFHKAKKHIYIQTPYFIPDNVVFSSLKIAALSGVDVRLMIPCKPDDPFVYWATCSYAGELGLWGPGVYL